MEMIKRLDEIQATLEQRFNQVILETETAAKEIIRDIAYDTGDMEFAVSHKLAVRDGENWVGEVFVDPGKLYNKRKHYARSSKLYPIYVHNGTKGWSGSRRGKYNDFTLTIPPMKARPYFRLAWEKIRTSKEFQNLTKDIILMHGEK